MNAWLLRAGTTVASNPVAGFDGVLAISGNQFVNGHGTPLLLQGANNSGLELCGPFGEHPWGGTPPDYALMEAWGFNIARYPLNSDSWLGLTTFTPVNATTWGASNGSQDPFGDYQAAVLDVIAACRAIQCYWDLELHWGSFQLTLGGVTHRASWIGQNAFMDANSTTFWTSLVAGIATRYGSAAFNTAHGYNGGAAGVNWDPTIGGPTGFGDGCFGLFNEPFQGNAGETFSAGSADLSLLNGGTSTKFVTNGAPFGNITTSVTFAGYQACLNAIRAAGAVNPVLVAGREFTQNLANYTVWKPTDTLNQVAMEWHPYCQSAWPNTVTPFTFPSVGDDSGAGTSASFSHAQAIMDAGIPVAITEDGSDNGNNAGTFEVVTTNGGYDPHIDAMATWAHARNIMYVPWTFGGQDFYQAFGTTGAANVLLRRNAAGTALLPIQGAGWSAYKYISGNAAPSTTNGSSLPGGAASGAYSVTFVGQGGAGAPYTFADVSDSGSGLGTINAATGVKAGTLTATPGTYAIKINVLDQYLIIGQYSYSITVTGTPSNILLGLTVESSIGRGNLTDGAGVAPGLVQLIMQGNGKPGDNQGLGGDGHGPGTVNFPNRQSIGFKSVAGASDYNIYRSTTTVAGTNGLYLSYATLTATAAASNYSAYVTSCTNANGGSPFDPGPGIDCVYTDNSATTCVSPTDTKGPSSGIYYGPVIGYTYKVTAVVGGVEGPLSDDSIAIFMAGGAWVFCGGIFNAPPIVTKSTPAPSNSPLGFSNATFMKLGHFPATQAFVNPFSGSGCVWGNLNVTGYNFRVINVYPTAWHNGDMQQSTEIDGDLFIYNTITPTMNVTLNQWNTFKFPLSSFLNSSNGSGSTMNAAANGVRQTSFYKTTWNNGAALNTDMTFYWEDYFSVH